MVQFVGDALKYFKILRQSAQVRSDYLHRRFRKQNSQPQERDISPWRTPLNEADGRHR